MSEIKPRWKRMGWKRPWRNDAAQANRAFKEVERIWSDAYCDKESSPTGYAAIFRIGTYINPIKLYKTKSYSSFSFTTVDDYKPSSSSYRADIMDFNKPWIKSCIDAMVNTAESTEDPFEDMAKNYSGVTEEHLKEAFGGFGSPVIDLSKLKPMTFNGKPLIGMTEAKGNMEKNDRIYRWKLGAGTLLDPTLRYSSFGEVMGTVKEYEEYKESLARGEKWETYMSKHNELLDAMIHELIPKKDKKESL